MNTEASEMTEAQAAPSSPIQPQTKKEESHFVEAIDAPLATIDENPVKPQDFDATVRVAKDSSVRKLISFVMSRLEQGGTVTV